MTDDLRDMKATEAAMTSDQRPDAVREAEADRARATVRRLAATEDEAVELLAMLGLVTS